MGAQRRSIDCRDYPSEKNCSLKISGTEEEVLDAAVQHAVSAHGYEETVATPRADQIDAQGRERITLQAFVV
jgi:predicted small metal-binding protein